MPRALSPAAFLSALQAEGVNLCPDCLGTDWASNTRGALADMDGCVLHHTASNITPTSLIRDGRPDLNGPLSMAHMTRDAVVHLTGYGRCNHAGMLDGDVLAAVRDGRPAPAPDRDTLNGNVRTYSLEVNGTSDGQPWTPDMVDQAVRFNAAICRAHGWNAYHVIGHREGTRRKPGDPAGVQMSTVRTLVATRLGQAPKALALGDRLLERGSVGADVEALQRLLGIKPDGDFGPATELAVRTFQHTKGLTVDGVVGPATVKALLPNPPATDPEKPVFIVQDPRGPHHPSYVTDKITRRWVQTSTEYDRLGCRSMPRLDLTGDELDRIPLVGRDPGTS